MKVKFISDTHNEHHLIPSNELDCDILIHCGDAGTKGNFTELDNFLTWFIKQPAKYKVYVPGNHDRHIKKSTSVLKDKCEKYGVILLDNTHVRIKDKLIVGGTSTPHVKKGIYGNEKSSRQKSWEFLQDYEQEKIDILVTHAPPRNILDMNREGYPCGCDVLLDYVKHLKPTFHAFGHIHEEGGIEMLYNGTHFINAACKNRDYTLVRTYKEITLK